jgi:hypothetical protein
LDGFSPGLSVGDEFVLAPILPLKSSMVGNTRSLDLKSINKDFDGLLVKMFAICKLDGTCWIFKTPLHTNSRTKWISMLICRDHFWAIGLRAIKIGLALSQNRVGLSDGWRCKSWRMFNKHLTSAAVRAKALYSDSAEEWETVDCFLEVQETRLSPKKMAYPDVDQLLFGQPAQLASEKA